MCISPVKWLQLAVFACGVGCGFWHWRRRSRGAAESPAQVVHRLTHVRIVVHGLGDLVDGVEHGGVVATADASTDLREVVGGELASEVHRDVTCPRHRTLPAAGEERFACDAELLGGGVDDLGQPAGVRVRLWPSRRSTWRTSAGEAGSPLREA
jgi:hypothetical protein